MMSTDSSVTGYYSLGERQLARSGQAYGTVTEVLQHGQVFGGPGTGTNSLRFARQMSC